MSSENDVADRLLSEARKKTAKQDSPKMGKVALIVGIIAVIVSPISILGWIFGAAAVGSGVVAVRRPVSMKRGKIHRARDGQPGGGRCGRTSAATGIGSGHAVHPGTTLPHV